MQDTSGDDINSITHAIQMSLSFFQAILNDILLCFCQFISQKLFKRPATTRNWLVFAKMIRSLRKHGQYHCLARLVWQHGEEPEQFLQFVLSFPPTRPTESTPLGLKLGRFLDVEALRVEEVQDQGRCAEKFKRMCQQTRFMFGRDSEQLSPGDWICQVNRETERTKMLDALVSRDRVVMVCIRFLPQHGFMKDDGFQIQQGKDLDQKKLTNQDAERLQPESVDSTPMASGSMWLGKDPSKSVDHTICDERHFVKESGPCIQFRMVVEDFHCQDEHATGYLTVRVGDIIRIDPSTEAPVHFLTSRQCPYVFGYPSDGPMNDNTGGWIPIVVLVPCFYHYIPNVLPSTCAC